MASALKWQLSTETSYRFVGLRAICWTTVMRLSHSCQTALRYCLHWLTATKSNGWQLIGCFRALPRHTIIACLLMRNLPIRSNCCFCSASLLCQLNEPIYNRKVWHKSSWSVHFDHFSFLAFFVYFDSSVHLCIFVPSILKAFVVFKSNDVWWNFPFREIFVLTSLQITNCTCVHF